MMSILFFPGLPTIKSEEFLCSCGRRASDFFQRNSASTGDLFRDKSRVCRLTSFSAKRDRREIRAVGLDHEAVHGYFCCDLSHLFPVLERNDPGEGNEMAETENVVSLFERSAEAVKDAAHLAAVIAKNFQRVVPRIALMNHCVHSQLRRKVEKLFE